MAGGLNISVLLARGEINLIKNIEKSEESKDYIERWHRRVQAKITKERRET